MRQGSHKFFAFFCINSSFVQLYGIRGAGSGRIRMWHCSGKCASGNCVTREPRVLCENLTRNRVTSPGWDSFRLHNNNGRRMSELKINTAWLNKLFHVFVSVQVTIQGAMWQNGKVAKLRRNHFFVSLLWLRCIVL